MIFFDYFSDIFYPLLVSNIAIYGVLGYKFLSPLLSRRPKDYEMGRAFEALEDALTRSFPDLPPGYTWAEGIARARRLDLKINWSKVEETLRSYEALKYGGERNVLNAQRRERGSSAGEVLKLAYSLPRRPRRIDNTKSKR